MPEAFRFALRFRRAPSPVPAGVHNTAFLSYDLTENASPFPENFLFKSLSKKEIAVVKLSKKLVTSQVRTAIRCNDFQMTENSNNFADRSVVLIFLYLAGMTILPEISVSLAKRNSGDIVMSKTGRDNRTGRQRKSRRETIWRVSRNITGSYSG